MQPRDIQQVGEQLAISWDDGSETFFSLETMRRHCPCAACKGEMDIMGNVYKAADQKLSPQAFQLAALRNVGGYAINPVWRDGHSTGIFSYEYLRNLGE